MKWKRSIDAPHFHREQSRIAQSPLSERSERALSPSQCDKGFQCRWATRALGLRLNSYLSFGISPSRELRKGSIVMAPSAANSWSLTGCILAPQESLPTHTKWLVLFAFIVAWSSFLKIQKKCTKCRLFFIIRPFKKLWFFFLIFDIIGDWMSVGKSFKIKWNFLL